MSDSRHPLTTVTLYPGSVAPGPSLERAPRQYDGVAEISFTSRNKPDGMCSVHVRSTDSEEVSPPVLTLFKDVDWVARRTTTRLGMERLCGMSLAHRINKLLQKSRG